MDYHELDMLCGNLQEELNVMIIRMKRLEQINEELTRENNMLREQSRSLERQVYNGNTM